MQYTCLCCGLTTHFVYSFQNWVAVPVPIVAVRDPYEVQMEVILIEEEMDQKRRRIEVVVLD